ncbi:hypothetical protein [Streptomyces sp. NPDC088915]|uniref:hypothetical protein n=1 Tax=Streptomyces sp. NPDC088915 TaxID=3365912 RepID=UPI00380F8350
MALGTWLDERNGRASALRWSTQIEHEAEATGIPAIELFFTLLDRFPGPGLRSLDMR